MTDDRLPSPAAGPKAASQPITTRELLKPGATIKLGLLTDRTESAVANWVLVTFADNFGIYGRYSPQEQTADLNRPALDGAGFALFPWSAIETVYLVEVDK
jgi:hypothetical protein